jgi:N-acetylneuraminic acid mutarotase
MKIRSVFLNLLLFAAVLAGIRPVSTAGSIPAVAVPIGCSNISVTDSPAARHGQMAVWTGKEMIVWGGSNSAALNTGGRYNPATDIWAAVSTTNAPEGRFDHTAVWTGSEMIVWGGFGSSSYLNTGARYNPLSDTWISLTTSGAPVGRYQHTAVWTGGRMILWGGQTNTDLYSGAMYNPYNWTYLPLARTSP